MSEGESTVESTEATPSSEGGQVDGGENSAATSNTDEGQGTSQAPAQEAGQANADGSPGSGKEGEAKASEAPKFDNKTLKWLNSKGYGTDHFDPTNESHNKLISQMREMESQATKAQQEKAAQQAIEKAKKTAPPAETEDNAPEGPLGEYDQHYGNKLQVALELYGATDYKDLYNKSPETYEKLRREYNEGRQLAWEKHQDWKQDQQKKAAEEADYENSLRKDFETARTVSEENLKTMREKYPDLEKNFTKYGVNNFTKTLADKFKVYPEMLFTDPKIAEFISEAADAIAYRHAEPDRLKQWEQDYEKRKLEAAKANGPRPAGTSKGEGAKPTSSGTSWIDAINSQSKPLVKTK